MKITIQSRDRVDDGEPENEWADMTEAGDHVDMESAQFYVKEVGKMFHCYEYRVKPEMITVLTAKHADHGNTSQSYPGKSRTIADTYAATLKNLGYTDIVITTKEKT